MSSGDRIIIALDVDSETAAWELVETLGEAATTYKVGLQLLTSTGPSVVRRLSSAGKAVFLDLKLHEIVLMMRESIRTDPLRVAQYVEPADVLMFITTHDKVVPTRTQESLRSALGMPRAYYLDTNHYVALIHIFMVRHRSYRFFEESFGLIEPN